MQVSSKVTAAFKQVPLVDYLATRFTYRPFAAWQQLAADGRVLCNGQVCSPDTLVTQGDVVTCELPEVEIPPANFDYAIVYEDDWLLGINKPANLRVHDKGKFVRANLMYHLRENHTPPYPEAQLINRLDKDTSGVVLVAKEKTVVPSVAQQFLEQQVEKTYLALVVGVPAQATGVIDLPIGKVAGATVPRFGVENVTAAKEAITVYEVIRPFSADYSLLKITPKSGRTHQIRVHLAAIGHPIVGDALYTMDDETYLAWCKNKTALPLLSRQALHCQQTRFTHPVTHLPCLITAPLTADFANLLQTLERQ